MSTPEVTIIDYGAGNLLSVRRGFEHCGAQVNLAVNPDEILKADRLVLPGVGAFSNAMEALKGLDMVSIIHEVAIKGTPILGICLGMQLMLDKSEEFGITEGLGIIPGSVVPVPNQTSSGNVQKVPHIGWSKLHPSKSISNWKKGVLQNTLSGESVYFVHSYMAEPTNSSNRIADCLYGGHKVAAVIRSENVIGCQFHPEKSGEAGLKILGGFLLE